MQQMKAIGILRARVDKKKGLANNLRIIRKNLIADRYLYIMLIPFLLFFIIFQYKPMYGLQIAFKKYSLFKGIEASPWLGFQYFKEFFISPYFFRVLKNTIMINLYGLVFSFPAPIILALLFNEVRNEKFKRLTQTLTYLPHFVSVVVVAGLVTNFLAPTNGLINILIDKLGGEKTYFLSKPEYFRSIYIGMGIWKETGFAAVIYVAALAGIDVQLYEAAVIDGANRWKQLIHVTLPGILPTIVIMLILRVGSLLEVGYETIILIYTPATYETSDVISTYVYRAGLQEGRYDFATAVGLFNSIVALILVFTANKISNKLSQTGIW